MSNECFVEGYRQLRLGALWSCCAYLAEAGPHRKDTAVLRLTSRIKDEVITPFVRVEWFPGIAGLVRDACSVRWQKLQGVDPLVDACAFPNALFDCLSEEIKSLKEINAESLRRAVAASAGRFVAQQPGKTWKLPQGKWLSFDYQAMTPAKTCHAWIDQARALAAWRRLSREEMSPPPAAPSEEAAALRDECAGLAARVARQGFWSKLRLIVLPLFPDPVQRQLSRQVESTLHRCVETLGDPKGPHDEASRSWFNELAREIDRLVASWSSNWPAALLAELPQQTGLDSDRFFDLLDGTPVREDTSRRLLTDGGRCPEDLPGLTCGAEGRVYLVDRICSTLDQMAVARDVWERVQETVNRLLAGRDLEVRLLFTREMPDLPARILQDASSEEWDAGATRPACRSVGILAKRGDSWICLQPATFVNPSATLGLVAALEGLGQAIQGMSPLEAETSKCCLALAKTLRSERDLRAWWDRDDDKNARSELWTTLQYASLLAQVYPQHQAGVQHLFQLLAANCFHLSDRVPDAAKGQLAKDGLWLCLDDAPGEEPAAAGEAQLFPGVALCVRGPNPQWFGPAVWLRTTHRPPGAGELSNMTNLVAELAWRDPHCSDWITHYDRFALAVAATRNRKNVTSETVESGLCLLGALDRRRRLPPQPEEDDRVAPQLCAELLRRVYRCLTGEMRLNVVPRIEDDRPLYVRLADVPFDCVEIEWQRGAEAGEIIDFDGFTDGRRRRRWKVGCGDASDDLLAWLRLPPPPTLPVGRGPGGAQGAVKPELLLDWRKAFIQSALRGEDFTIPAAQRRELTVRWLRDADDGRRWFDHLARSAAGFEGDEKIAQTARSWLDALVTQRWCDCLPALTAGENVCVWPSSVSANVSGVTFAFSETLSPGQVVGAVRHFGVTPGLAQCTVSLGRSEPDSPLTHLERLCTSVQDPRLAAFREPIEELFRATADRSLRGEATPDPDCRAVELLGALVAAISASGKNVPYDPSLGVFVGEPSFAARWDEVLVHLRRWARAYGLEILPRNWTFRDRIVWRDLDAAEQQAAVAMFSNVDAGRVFLRQFGLTDSAGVAKLDLRCGVSAGPAPAFYGDLMKLTADSSGEAPAQLHKFLAVWPTERLHDEAAFQDLAVNLFVLYWQYQPQWQADDAERPSQFRRHLENMLTQSFRLEIREPKDRDVTASDWVTIREQPPRGGQHLKQVVRPGLFLEGLCKVPAEVDLQ